MKIGIFGTWGNGDVIISTPVLKYKDMLWPESQIVWITMANKSDIFAYNPLVSDVRTPPNPHSLPSEIFFTPGYSPTTFKKTSPVVEDLDALYFPMLWLHKDMLGLPYGLVHREIFRYNKSLPVHPCLFFSHADWEASPTSIREFLLKRGWIIEAKTKAIHGPGHITGTEFGCLAIFGTVPSGSNIVVCGYPKSGNTWLARLLAEAIDCPSAGYFLLPHWDEIAIEGTDRVSTYKIWKTHSGPEIIDSKAIEIGKVIYIVRNVLDVVVSATYYFGNGNNHEDIYQRMLEGEFSGLCWKEHVSKWLDRGVYCIKYEDLLTNANAKIKEIVEYLGLTPVNETIARAVYNQSFAVKKRGLSGNLAAFLRRGKAGQYSEIPPELSKKISVDSEIEMKRLGYTIWRS